MTRRLPARSAPSFKLAPTSRQHQASQRITLWTEEAIFDSVTLENVCFRADPSLQSQVPVCYVVYRWREGWGLREGEGNAALDVIADEGDDERGSHCTATYATHNNHQLSRDSTPLIVAIGKFGSFPANLLLGRPYHLTFDILEKDKSRSHAELRIVSASELHAEAILSDGDTPTESRDEVDGTLADGVEYDIRADGSVSVRSNRNTVDDASRQTLSFEDIEELKKLRTGKEIVETLMQSHSGIDEKTAFSLAKYAVRKRGKYLKRFTVLPLDVSLLLEWVLTEKDAPRVMELREEMLGLMMCYSNAHFMKPLSNSSDHDEVSASGRWLVVDETSGLLVAALAEKMGVLYPEEEEEQEEETDDEDYLGNIPPVSESNGVFDRDQPQIEAVIEQEASDHGLIAIPSSEGAQELSKHSESNVCNPRPKKRLATSNTITLLHAAHQPNLALLKYFDFDETMSNEKHPLYTHLKTLSWLQLLSPEDDAAYQQPETVDEEVLKTWRSGKRSNYFRKQRRWERVKSIVDETQRGGFDGLVIASAMEPAGILCHLIPLLKGGAPVVVYNPNVEPLAELADLYSRSRRTAFLTNPPNKDEMPNEDFPIDPTLMINTIVQSSRARSWQVLPGRTHPLMMARGGAEGYVFTGIRVLKGAAKPKARGRYTKKRKVEQIDELEGSSV
ncbi:MAG: tRNA (adenine(58)-N(1))-methyltransferase non-catalytic subunit trm6 [Bathelium mastoideum]|nr:MAG: tRNA (adenine(58)-N(1))-methyltransferase non-catalytic subunit trm6 [Bathelium mastoideum]